MALNYHIRIKKDYAASLIEDLEKVDAIELISQEDQQQIPQWQIDEVISRIEKYKDSPELMIDEDKVFKMLDSE